MSSSLEKSLTRRLSGRTGGLIIYTVNFCFLNVEPISLDLY